jgi:hypothetical protein
MLTAKIQRKREEDSSHNHQQDREATNETDDYSGFESFMRRFFLQNARIFSL